MNLVCRVVVFLNLLTISVATLKFTNIQCNEIDKQFATFEKCHLKVMQRGVVALNINIKLFQTPLTNITFNISLYKKSNGYLPFMYNATIDFCQFMKNRKSYRYMDMIIKSVASFSNLNHSCPYDHDIIISNMILKEFMFQYAPFPSGSYMIRFKGAAYNKYRVDVKAFMEIDIPGLFV